MADVRNQIVHWAEALLADKAHFNYAEVRPIPLHNPPQFPVTTDCSGFVTLCFYLAGANDPNQLNYSGQGYTGTLLDHGLKLSRQAVIAGDVVVYGAYPGQHTALVVQVYPNGDILTISHGEQGDPSLVWCGTPKGKALGHPTDTRTPVEYLRFPTRSKDDNAPHKALVGFVRKVAKAVKK
jgi:hypothetical protein